ncbi:MAG: hypothetical protein OSB26_15400, partial [Woeseiaceae bacterium]|nr:hypothetical protein [Woeseiaceae bacterium]
AMEAHNVINAVLGNWAGAAMKTAKAASAMVAMKAMHANKISECVIGKNEGDEISFSAPAGDKHYEIIEVRYV